jgi:hypothetical protein
MSAVLLRNAKTAYVRPRRRVATSMEIRIKDEEKIIKKRIDAIRKKIWPNPPLVIRAFWACA